MLFFPECCLVLLNSAGLDEIQHFAAFLLCLHCLANYQISLGISSTILRQMGIVNGSFFLLLLTTMTMFQTI